MNTAKTPTKRKKKTGAPEMERENKEGKEGTNI